MSPMGQPCSVSPTQSGAATALGIQSPPWWKSRAAQLVLGVTWESVCALFLSHLLLIFPGLFIAGEAPQGLQWDATGSTQGEEGSHQHSLVHPTPGRNQVLCRNRSLPSADSKEGGEAKSWSSCFFRGGDDHGFRDIPLPWHVGSTAGQCWGQDTVGMGSAQRFNLERTDVCWQWQKNLPGILGGQEARPGDGTTAKP